MKVPTDEMFLAKLIQNAKASGLFACRYAKFRDRQRHVSDADRAAFCCVVGAAIIAPDTARPLKGEYGLASKLELNLNAGNDGAVYKPHWVFEPDDIFEPDAFEVGQAFYDACRNPRKRKHS